MEKAVIMTDGDAIGDEHLALAPPKTSTTTATRAPQLTTLDEMEADAIRRAIDAAGANMSLVAQTLGISRQTLYNKMKRYGI